MKLNWIDGTVLDRYSSPVRGREGRYYGRIWTFRDITERRKLESQFRQAQKMEAVGQLAGGVAHDFNNILAVIQMQAGLLQTSGHLPAELLEFAEGIGAAAQRGAALTRQLLLFSRKQIMQPRVLDLNQSINDITKMLRRILGEDIQMQFKFAMQPLFIHADAGMIDQVLMNLAVNARDAMPKGGKLVIDTSTEEFDGTSASKPPGIQPGSFVCLSVSDTGCGIPPEHLAENLRAVLHHQGSRQRHRPRAGHRLWHRSTAQGLDQCLQRSRARNHLSDLSSALEQAIRAKTGAARTHRPAWRQ